MISEGGLFSGSLAPMSGPQLIIMNRLVVDIVHVSEVHMILFEKIKS